LLWRGLSRVLSVPGSKRLAWEGALERVMTNEFTRMDVKSHFSVVADLIRSRQVRARGDAGRQGQVIVMTAANDPTQNPRRGFPSCEVLCGRRIEVLDCGTLGHTAAMVDPERFIEMLDRALA
jgi:hypothetical protein